MGDTKLFSFLVFGGIRVVLYLSIVLLAIIAARRYKLSGLWILAVAALVEFVQVVFNSLLASPWRPENFMNYVGIVGNLSYAAAFIAFVGWCMMAFGSKK